MRMRNRHPKLLGFFWSFFVLTLMVLAFTLAFYLTDYFFQFSGLTLPALLVQIVNSFLGLVFTGLIFSAFSRNFRRQQLGAFQPIIDAMERIARGDFSIRLENESADGIISGLVASINKMAQDLGQMETMRQEFISNVSHEIQSPLTSIRGFAQALQADTLTIAERHHYLDIIETESNRLSRLTDDLLKLASLDADQVQFAPQSYRLDKQIRSVVLTCEPQWRAKALELDLVLDEVSLNADESLLNQVWINLLHNAIKFTQPGGSLRLSLHPNADRAEFSLTDTGVGIPAANLVHIFERFYKADKSRTGSQGGSGLGLAIVKKIIELHKGTISVKSEVGKGTTFIVSLPVEPK